MFGDKAKMLAKVFRLKKEVEKLATRIEDKGIEVEVAGFMAMGEPRIKSLMINGEENKILLEIINKALKKAAKSSMMKMKEFGGSQGLM